MYLFCFQLMPTKKHILLGIMMMTIIVVYKTAKVLEPSSVSYTSFASWSQQSKTYYSIMDTTAQWQSNAGVKFGETRPFISRLRSIVLSVNV